MTLPVPPSPSSAAGLVGVADAPREPRPIVVLLMINLALSIALTLATLLARHSIVNYQLDHRHITDPTVRDTLRNSCAYGIVG